MANEIILNALRRFYPTEADVRVLYQAAMTAQAEGATEVQITSSLFEGGQASGVVPTKDPLELMDACEERLLELEAAEDGDAVEQVSKGAMHFDFSRRVAGT